MNTLLRALTVVLCALTLSLCGCASFPKMIGHAENYAAGKVPVGGDLLRSLAKSHLTEKVPDGWRVYWPIVDKNGVEVDTSEYSKGKPRLVPVDATKPSILLAAPESDGEAIQLVTYLETMFPGAKDSMAEAAKIKELLGDDPLGAAP